jgi:hypothetical protein
MPSTVAVEIVRARGQRFFADIANLTPRSFFLKTKASLEFREIIDVTLFDITFSGEVVYVATAEPWGALVVFTAPEVVLDVIQVKSSEIEIIARPDPAFNDRTEPQELMSADLTPGAVFVEPPTAIVEITDEASPSPPEVRIPAPRAASAPSAPELQSAASALARAASSPIPLGRNTSQRPAPRAPSRPTAPQPAKVGDAAPPVDPSRSGPVPALSSSPVPAKVSSSSGTISAVNRPSSAPTARNPSAPAPPSSPPRQSSGGLPAMSRTSSGAPPAPRASSSAPAPSPQKRPSSSASIPVGQRPQSMPPKAESKPPAASPTAPFDGTSPTSQLERESWAIFDGDANPTNPDAGAEIRAEASLESNGAELPLLESDGVTLRFSSIHQYKAQHKANIAHGGIIARSGPIPIGTQKFIGILIPGKDRYTVSARVTFIGAGTVGFGIDSFPIHRAQLKAFAD